VRVFVNQEKEERR